MPPTTDGQARDVCHPHIEQGFDLDLTSRLLNSDIGCVNDVPTISSLRPTKLDDYIRIHTNYLWQPLSHLAPAGLPLTSPHCYSNLEPDVAHYVMSARFSWHAAWCLRWPRKGGRQGGSTLVPTRSEPSCVDSRPICWCTAGKSVLGLTHCILLLDRSTDTRFALERNCTRPSDALQHGGGLESSVDSMA